MKLSIYRRWFSTQSIIGMLDVDSIFECYSLEPPRPHNIPAGLYKGKKYFSPHLNRIVLSILNVPGFTDIEIHNGNFPVNTHGCTLVGKSRSYDSISNSVAALDQLLARIPDNEEIDVEYLDMQEVSA